MSAALVGGFAAPSLDSARAFRAALDAMARPGRIVALDGARPPAPLSPAAGALALALCDPETPIWLGPSVDRPETREWLAFHCGAPVVADRGAALFAIARWEEASPLAGFALGEPDRPEASATLILDVDALEGGARLTGPGVAGRVALGVPPALGAERAALPPFPLGLDIYLVAGSRAAGLPRTTRVG